MGKNGKKYICKKCGLKHGQKCPAFEKICRNYNGYKHFMKMCIRAFQKLDFIETKSDSESGSDNFFVGMMNEDPKESKRNNKYVQC